MENISCIFSQIHVFVIFAYRFSKIIKMDAKCEFPLIFRKYFEEVMPARIQMSFVKYSHQSRDN